MEGFMDFVVGNTLVKIIGVVLLYTFIYKILTAGEGKQIEKEFEDFMVDEYIRIKKEKEKERKKTEKEQNPTEL